MMVTPDQSKESFYTIQDDECSGEGEPARARHLPKGWRVTTLGGIRIPYASGEIRGVSKATVKLKPDELGRSAGQNKKEFQPKIRHIIESPPFTCPICLGPVIEATTSTCGHIFCKRCIQTAQSYVNACPICRWRFRQNIITRLYDVDKVMEEYFETHHGEDKDIYIQTKKQRVEELITRMKIDKRSCWKSFLRGLYAMDFTLRSKGWFRGSLRIISRLPIFHFRPIFSKTLGVLLLGILIGYFFGPLLNGEIDFTYFLRYWIRVLSSGIENYGKDYGRVPQSLPSVGIWNWINNKLFVTIVSSQTI